MAGVSEETKTREVSDQRLLKLSEGTGIPHKVLINRDWDRQGARFCMSQRKCRNRATLGHDVLLKLHV